MVMPLVPILAAFSMLQQLPRVSGTIVRNSDELDVHTRHRFEASPLYGSWRVQHQSESDTWESYMNGVLTGWEGTMEVDFPSPPYVRLIFPQYLPIWGRYYDDFIPESVVSVAENRIRLHCRAVDDNSKNSATLEIDSKNWFPATYSQTNRGGTRMLEHIIVHATPV
ncbi:hypothetical protein EF294_02865 [Gordonia oryzae]|uniref:Uncharacterized protein n=1 Tax=Gordonia oryzae TaxID=2487349 RepID=A0A3N4GSC1_9ACTN|nr:hypothetical protein [Gordonia oryzae]RPA65702.1 hypothetical protein EF294_02865 [Gordonia oryzae]